MRQALNTLVVVIVAISCNEQSESYSMVNPDDQNIQAEQIELSDTTKEIQRDTLSHEPEIGSMKVKPGIEDLSGTTTVKTTQFEIEFVDAAFKHQLDSLIRYEKKCPGSSGSELHWTFFKMTEDKYEFTAHTDFGGNFQGYALIDNSVVFFGPELPSLYSKTERKKDFVFENKKFPYPEDYSVWIFSLEDGVMKVIKSYTLPCD